MLARRTTLLMTLLATIALATCNAAAQPIAKAYKIKAGEQHADFFFPNIQNGEPVSLSQFRGKKVLLVHFASW